MRRVTCFRVHWEKISQEQSTNQAVNANIKLSTTSWRRMKSQVASTVHNWMFKDHTPQIQMFKPGRKMQLRYECLLEEISRTKNRGSSFGAEAVPGDLWTCRPVNLMACRPVILPTREHKKNLPTCEPPDLVTQRPAHSSQGLPTQSGINTILNKDLGNQVIPDPILLLESNSLKPETKLQEQRKWQTGYCSYFLPSECSTSVVNRDV